jgi:hypothetical protein
MSRKKGKSQEKKRKFQDSCKPDRNERNEDQEGTVHADLPNPGMQFRNWNEKILHLLEIFRNQESLR